MADLKNKQLRTLTIPKVSFRAATADQPATVFGYAAVFNSLSEPLWEYGGGREMMAPGAFTDVLATADVRCLMNHDANLVLGRNTSGTLTLKEDATGLYFECSLGEQSYAKDLAISMGRGDISGCSFAFCILDSSTKEVDGEPVQVIQKVEDLSDVSVVTYPAYTAASASVRSKLDLVFNPQTKSPVVPENTNKLANQKRLLDLLILE